MCRFLEDFQEGVPIPLDRVAIDVRVGLRFMRLRALLAPYVVSESPHICMLLRSYVHVSRETPPLVKHSVAIVFGLQ